MNIWQRILCPFNELGLKTYYDNKAMKKAYWRWLKQHHPDKGKSTEDDEIFLRVYTNIFKDLQNQADSMWANIIEIENAILHMDSADTEEKLLEIRKVLHPYIEFDYISEEDYPANYARAISHCLKVVQDAIFAMATDYCTEHFQIHQTILKSGCKKCKEKEGLLTKCEEHSTLFKTVYKEDCSKCVEEPIIYSDDELPDLEDFLKTYDECYSEEEAGLETGGTEAEKGKAEGDREAVNEDDKKVEEDDECLSEEEAGLETGGTEAEKGKAEGDREAVNEDDKKVEEEEAEGKKDEVKLKHPSIVVETEINPPVLLSATADSEGYKCRLCPEDIIIQHRDKNRHATLHNRFIKTPGYHVLMCKLNCITSHQKHYHCPYCGKTINRRTDAENHFKKCHSGKKKQGKKPTAGNISEDHPSPVHDSSFHHISSESDNNRNCSSPSLDEDMNTASADNILHRSIYNITTANISSFCKVTSANTFVCSLCPENRVMGRHLEKSHISLHASSFITTDTKKILLCKQKCHPNSKGSSHYHCPSCTSVVIKKKEAIDHVRKCPLRQRNKMQNAFKHKKEVPEKQRASPSSRNLYSRYSAKREKRRVKCTHIGCDADVFSYNLLNHIKNCHTVKPPTVTEKNYLVSRCVDRHQGIYLVLSGKSGPNVPIHVQKKVAYGQISSINCEDPDCKRFNELSRLGGKVHFECKHVQSIIFNNENASVVILKETELLKKILKPETIKLIKKQKKENNLSRAPFVSVAKFENDERRVHFSVAEKDNKHVFSTMNRVRVTYDKQDNIWICVCCGGRSCTHKYISKWALLIQHPEMLQSMSSENVADDFGEREIPRNVALLRKILDYQYENKRIPVPLPADILEKSRNQEFPHHFYPKEKECCECHEPLIEEIITSKAQIITKSGIIDNIQVFQKRCMACGMIFYYQDYTDGVHNFDSKVLLSLELCIHLRYQLSTHTAISRAMDAIELEYDIVVAYKKQVLDAYCHFESLSNHAYDYNCYICGKHPVILIGDGNKKTVYNITVDNLPPVPSSYEGKVNCAEFWQDIDKEMLSRSFGKGIAEFKVNPSFHYWAGWIGEFSRKNEIWNTEYEKVKGEKRKTRDNLETSTDEITDEHLQDLLLAKDEATVRKVCKSVGISTQGSKADMIIRLKRQAKVPDLYKKILTKIKGHSGGWIGLVCPHGIVYGVKFLLRAESVRDYSDILSSLEHFPNIVCGDLAPRLATHTNLRFPEVLPFQPFNGCFEEATEDNITAAKDGTLSTSLPWLSAGCAKLPPDDGGHPLTGSNQHFSCLDRLHEKNWKGDEHKLRSTKLVKELAGVINTQAAEHLNSDVGKNNYFLNMMSPSTQTYIMRLQIELRNNNINEKHRKKLKRTFPQELLHFDKFGRLGFENTCTIPEHDSDTDSDCNLDLESNLSDTSLCVDSELEARLDCSNEEVELPASEDHSYCKRKYSNTRNDESTRPKNKKFGADNGQAEDSRTKDNNKKGADAEKNRNEESTRPKNKKFGADNGQAEDSRTKDNNKKGAAAEKNRNEESTRPKKKKFGADNGQAEDSRTKDNNEKGADAEKNRNDESTRPKKKKFGADNGQAEDSRTKDNNKKGADAEKKRSKMEQENDREQLRLVKLRWHDYPASKPPGLAEVPEAYRKKIKDHTSQVISIDIQIHNYILRSHDLCTLKRNEWLNDQVINAYMNLLIHEQNMLDCNQTTLNAVAKYALHIDSFIMTSINVNLINSWLKKTNFSDYRFIFAVVHHGHHWCLIIVSMLDKEINFIDPLYPGQITPIGQMYIKKLKAYSVRRCILYKPYDDNFLHFKEIPINHNRQEDGNACGVFVLMFAEQKLTGRITPKQGHVPFFRWYVAYKLLAAGKLLDKDKKKSCDIQCKIHLSEAKTVVEWIQCDREMCSKWVHKFCVDLNDAYEGEFMCPLCTMQLGLKDDEQIEI